MSAWAVHASTRRWARMTTRERWLWLDTIRTQWWEQQWTLPPPALTLWLSKVSTLSKIAKNSYKRNFAILKQSTILALRNASCSQELAWCWGTPKAWDNSWQSTLTKNRSLPTSCCEVLPSCSNIKNRLVLQSRMKRLKIMKKKKKITSISSRECNFSHL